MWLQHEILGPEKKQKAFSERFFFRRASFMTIFFSGRNNPGIYESREFKNLQSLMGRNYVPRQYVTVNQSTKS